MSLEATYLLTISVSYSVYGVHLRTFYWKNRSAPITPPTINDKTAFHNLAYPSLLNSSVRLIDFSKYGGNGLHFPNVKIIADGIYISINSNIRSNIKRKITAIIGDEIILYIISMPAHVAIDSSIKPIYMQG